MSLTADQDQVVRAGLNDKILVLAGPGTGKTHTLVARIEALLAQDEGVASQEVLSLSFSRAAVGELRRRVSSLPGRRSRVRSATFDSYATRLLHLYCNDPWQVGSYDERIQLATELIEKGLVYEELNEIRHILIDEAQDLTGVRSAFVLALVAAIAGGFTVFADPAQAIYDFARRASSGPIFVEELTHLHAQGLVCVELTKNHRSVDRSLLRIASLGSLLRPPEAPRDEVLHEFDEVVRALPAAVAIKDVTPLLQVAKGVAVLTRRNSEALTISDQLHQGNVGHEYRRRADDPIVGGWLSRLQTAVGSIRLRQHDLELLPEFLPWDPDTTWMILCKIAKGGKDTVDLGKLAQTLLTKGLPDELIETGMSDLVVSTIHRAKGLEFGTVLLVPFEIKGLDWLQEARILYVGLTRAKESLLSLSRVDDGRWDFATRAGRWKRIRFAGKRKHTTGVEILGSDAWSFDPTGRLRPRAEPELLIDHLHRSVHPGDPVTLLRRDSEEADCVYDVHHDDRWVGATSASFSEVIGSRLGLGRVPASITGARVETVATKALPAVVADSFGLPHQLVPTCRIQGVGTWE